MAGNGPPQGSDTEDYAQASLDSHVTWCEQNGLGEKYQDWLGLYLRVPGGSNAYNPSMVNGEDFEGKAEDWDGLNDEQRDAFLTGTDFRPPRSNKRKPAGVKSRYDSVT